MPSIQCVATAVPQNRYDNDQILGAAEIWLKDEPTQRALFQRFVSSSQTAYRHFVQPISSVLDLNGMSGRAKLFETHAPQLGEECIVRACRTAAVDPREVGTFIFTSCSIPVIPSVDGMLVHRLRMNPAVRRLPIYQHGCAGGVIGLALANTFCEASDAPVLLTSVELCSLGFQSADLTSGNLVGSAIFGDGAASVVVSPSDEGLCFVASQSLLLEDSRRMMGYDIMDDGSHLRLDKELPSFLAENIPQIVPEFLSRHGLRVKDVPWWLFHPGGAKILNCLDEVFSLQPDQAQWARQVLRHFGNLSSASILFVLSEFLKSDVYSDREPVLMVGVGPGMTIELILFEYRAPASAQ